MGYVIEQGNGAFSSYFSEKAGRDVGAAAGAWVKVIDQATHFDTEELALEYLELRLPFQAPNCHVIAHEAPRAAPTITAFVPEHYATLGVDVDASEDEIRAAWRRLAMQHHPDRGGEAERFKQITAAYEVLSHVDKRRTYDATQGVPGAAREGPSGAR